MDLVMLRYVGESRVRVPKLNRVVEPDELVGVPKEVFKRYGWPESQWRREDPEQPAPSGGQKPPVAAGKSTTTTSGKGNNDA